MKSLFVTLMLLVGSSSFAQPVKLDPVQVNCLAKVIYHESRGEISKGQAAVAHVVLNRTRDPAFPPTVCKVIYQPNQFTNIRLTKPNINSLAWKQAVETATFSLLNQTPDPTNGAKYFYAHNLVKPQWGKGKQKIIIGNHTFL